jgi:hypothetical protein
MYVCVNPVQNPLKGGKPEDAVLRAFILIIPCTIVRFTTVYNSNYTGSSEPPSPHRATVGYIEEKNIAKASRGRVPLS